MTSFARFVVCEEPYGSEAEDILLRSDWPDSGVSCMLFLWLDGTRLSSDAEMAIKATVSSVVEGTLKDLGRVESYLSILRLQ